MGAHGVSLVSLLRALPRADRGLKAAVRVGLVEPLEDHERVRIGGQEGLVEQARRVPHPHVLDLPAPPVVDQDGQGVLLHSVGKADGDGLLAASDVPVVPAVAHRWQAEVRHPRLIRHALGRDPVGGLRSGGPQAGCPDRGEDAQQRQGLRRGGFLGAGNQRAGQVPHRHRLVLARPDQGPDHVGSPQLRVDRLADVAKHLLCLAQHNAECLSRHQRGEKLVNIGVILAHAGYFGTLCCPIG